MSSNSQLTYIHFPRPFAVHLFNFSFYVATVWRPLYRVYKYSQPMPTCVESLDFLPDKPHTYRPLGPQMDGPLILLEMYG
jgi:hypothetical protein